MTLMNLMEVERVMVSVLNFFHFNMIIGFCFAFSLACSLLELSDDAFDAFDGL